MSTAGLVGDIVGEWRKRAAGLPTLVFAVDRSHARRLTDEFTAAGVAVAYLDGETPRDERDRVKAAFRAGAVRIIVSVATLTTGVDLDVRCIVLARPTQSEILHVQIVGWGLRTAPGKERCLILDHAGNNARLGFVTDIHHDHLDDGRERPKTRTASTPKPIACPACTALRPPSRASCPACGDAPAPAARPVVHVAGTLREMRKPPALPSLEERQRWYSELLWIAQHRNYKSAWVGCQFKARFGAWPRGLSDRIARPGPDVLAHVQASRDAFRPPRYEDFCPGPP